jgi:hypothetical protein
MLKAVPKGWFSSKYELLNKGASVGLIEMAFASESAEMEIEGKAYKAYREGFMHGLFLFEAETGWVLASADKTSAFERSFELTIDGRTYILEAESALFRKFILIENGDTIGSIYPDGIFTTESTIDLPDTFPVHIQAFMFWLVALLWKRAADSTAGTT